MMKTRRKRLAVLGFVVAMAAVASPTEGDASGREPETAARAAAASRARRPEALVLVDGGRLLLAANGRSGSISVIDPAARRLVAEHDVGKGLADLASLPGGSHLVAVDRAASAVLLLE